ncbi:1-acylglycerol-3-phosphate O-acyltransferase [Photobacterium phosphoreum]|jgi:1-acyl-sn-glycerol-3-phosphate acyltransferase|uniref:1-acylglycerol-3-phosphate O-acyltransferase n=1 Tax=Photobacterium phosphoreum TaxID=659 RepID=UPI0005D2F4BA|nr:1-acylglycerol-3-phosphate O-acyltransferase [Photobacterium phosphoreum]KJF87813.1 acyl-phosphate glycerol 3-phosphate acyltransferase [Photobacterium phosphoreum]MCD9464462.1 1-acyl-sn-glycerol-3-phosphate acyltransferase [Photobacterium phosphoreum]MCD9471894.1 1-acyl-sn-glycerol-3-phosphate acyltransferase [Photobacterium phosphoreum]MCD9475509.1 1-acylglycerol-3-phosphate O-acyltransferase [Photobacterium phosphoreum]MCD9480025.1 1-acylglycerol-3-phosphate O-acyltransferase [Photobacte
MIYILRMIAIAIFAIVTFVFGCGYCLFSPRNPKHVYTFGRLFSKMSRVVGIKLEIRYAEGAEQVGPAVYIANHQNTYDLFTVSGAIMQRTVTVGKKSLVWIPLFGQLYWITGNILIDRANRSKAVGTIGQVVDKIKKNKVSVWMFPEGTRSRGRGLLPFKTGAFHAAIGAQVPIVPIVCSSTDKVKLNRWDNGLVIVEVMKPIATVGLEKEDVRNLLTQSRKLMATKLAELDQEVAQRNKH